MIDLLLYIIVATTLRYLGKVTDPSHFAEVCRRLAREELALMIRIVDKMTTKDLDLCVYHDGYNYKERIEGLIASKMKG